MGARKSACEGPPWSTFPEPAPLVILHLERRAAGHWLVALQDAADERLSRKGPVSDGKHTGCEAIVRVATEQVSEKQPSPFVARWRARLKRVHSDHG